MDQLARKITKLCIEQRVEIRDSLHNIHSFRLSIGSINSLTTNLSITPKFWRTLSEIPANGLYLDVLVGDRIYSVNMECLRLLMYIVAPAKIYTIERILKKAELVSSSYLFINTADSDMNYSRGLFIGLPHKSGNIANCKTLQIVLIDISRNIKLIFKSNLVYQDIIEMIEKVRLKCISSMSKWCLFTMLDFKGALVLLDGQPILSELIVPRTVKQNTLPITYICMFHMFCSRATCAYKHVGMCKTCRMFFSPLHIKHYHKEPTGLLGAMQVVQVKKMEDISLENMAIKILESILSKRRADYSDDSYRAKR